MTRETIVGRFLGAAGHHADLPAVLGDQETVTYAELASVAGGIRALLADAGVGPGDRVGLLIRNGPDAVAAILGTLAAGAAYVPLDPSYPPQRLADMARQADLAAFVAGRDDEPLARRLATAGPTPLLWHEDAGAAELRPADPRYGGARHDDAPAYLLFTSGSTGAPKAVAQTERNLLHCADNQIAALRIGAGDRLSLLASFSFDAAIPDLYPALLTGAAVVPVDLRGRGVLHVASALADRAVTVYHSTPTVFRYLIEALGPDGRLPAVRVVLLGGEPVTRADLMRGLPHFAGGCLFVNGYGATEATFVAHCPLTAAEVEAQPDGPLPIGRPLPGYEVILDDAGEIVVRGPHAAPGYWRDAERTAARFGVDADGTRVWRTGDLGQWLPDGRLRHLGRLDRQIKVRGFRVEPAEVEALLESAPEVARAVVVGRGEELVGYVQPAPAGLDPAGLDPAGLDTAGLDPARLRRGLAEALPDYLVPGAIVEVAEWPLTPTGKLDVLALPAPRPAVTSVPRTPAQQAVHEEWCAVLGLPGVGVDDSFFDVGGHSLLLGRLQQRLAARFGRPVSLVRLVERPTVRGHADYLTGPPAPATPPPTAQPDARRRTGDEIAVVGMAGRFPGAASVDALWWNLCAGVDAIHDYTDGELRALGIGPGLLDDPAHVKAGGRLPGVEDFDAELFGFGDDEAARTDPQHRLFLECAWEALEDAACDPERFDGSIGVFASASVNRYLLFHLMGNPALGTTDPDDWEGRLVPYQLGDHLPGQVAYRLGLTGPAIAVQSACSSSLVTVCLAAQSLLDFRCDLAIAGGASVTWPRYRYTPGGLVSPDGRCRSFDARGQGTGFSSGAGVVALKRLADAEADGDFVHAVLSGWAVTNDGAGRGGFPVPGVAGQVAAVTEALACAEVSPDDVGYVEAHGSGTTLGDAIEVTALCRAYRAGGAHRTGYCALGSVKTNIGHLDAAAGIAGFIKAVLAVEHGRIPANLHFAEPNPELDLAGGPFVVPVKTGDWPRTAHRIAGVNAIGLGGTNAHVILAQAPGRVPRPASPGPWRLPLSAHTPAALREVVTRLRAHLVEHPDLSLADVAHTLASGRRRLRHRTVVQCRDVAGAVAALDPDACATDGATWPDGTEGRRVRLPTYPFQRRRHWIEVPR
jgi:phthiocerol/phenolphthiocerol synthesis type-I polyketide synthase E